MTLTLNKKPCKMLQKPSKASIDLFREWLIPFRTNDEITHYVEHSLLHPYQNSLELLRLEVSNWAGETFGKERSFAAPLHHLKEELQEIIDGDGDIYEYADALILLLNSFSVKYPDTTAISLVKAARAKMEINKLRKWQEPDAQGVVRHIK